MLLLRAALFRTTWNSSKTKELGSVTVSQYVTNAPTGDLQVLISLQGYPWLLLFSPGNAEGSYCWFPSIQANQTQVDELHSRNLELPFSFGLANPVERRTGLSAWAFCLQHKILSGISVHAQRPDIIGCFGDTWNTNIGNAPPLSPGHALCLEQDCQGQLLRFILTGPAWMGV